jgi:hypothetical protein
MDMMTAMMPLMKPLVWLAALSFIAGVLLVVAGGPGWYKLSRITLWILAGIGIFFIAAQGMGALLGAQPSINFGDAKKFEFVLVPFWQLGIAALIGAGIVHALQRWKLR